MIGLDPYSIPARLFPAVIVVLPLGLAFAVWFPEDMLGWGAITAFFSTTGLALLLAELARRPGQARENELFRSWGGKPTSQLLRHRDETVDVTTKRRYHDCIARIVPDVRVPTVEDERADTRAADAVYDSCTRFLIEQTRDRKRFPLVFKELVSYGFCRNLWALKPVGIGLAVAGMLAAALRLTLAPRWASLGPPVGVAIADGLLLVVWWAVVKPAWVRSAAFAYARALLASCEVLRSPPP